MARSITAIPAATHPRLRSLLASLFMSMPSDSCRSARGPGDGHLATEQGSRPFNGMPLVDLLRSKSIEARSTHKSQDQSESIDRISKEKGPKASERTGDDPELESDESLDLRSQEASVPFTCLPFEGLPWCTLISPCGRQKSTKPSRQQRSHSVSVVEDISPPVLISTTVGSQQHTAGSPREQAPVLRAERSASDPTECAGHKSRECSIDDDDCECVVCFDNPERREHCRSDTSSLGSATEWPLSDVIPVAHTESINNNLPSAATMEAYLQPVLLFGRGTGMVLGANLAARVALEVGKSPADVAAHEESIFTLAKGMTPREWSEAVAMLLSREREIVTFKLKLRKRGQPGESEDARLSLHLSGSGPKRDLVGVITEGKEASLKFPEGNHVFKKSHSQPLDSELVKASINRRRAAMESYRRRRTGSFQEHGKIRQQGEDSVTPKMDFTLTTTLIGRQESSKQELEVEIPAPDWSKDPHSGPLTAPARTSIPTPPVRIPEQKVHLDKLPVAGLDRTAYAMNAMSADHLFLGVPSTEQRGPEEYSCQKSDEAIATPRGNPKPRVLRSPRDVPTAPVAWPSVSSNPSQRRDACLTRGGSAQVAPSHTPERKSFGLVQLLRSRSFHTAGRDSHSLPRSSVSLGKDSWHQDGARIGPQGAIDISSSRGHDISRGPRRLSFQEGSSSLLHDKDSLWDEDAVNLNRGNVHGSRGLEPEIEVSKGAKGEEEDDERVHLTVHRALTWGRMFQGAKHPGIQHSGDDVSMPRSKTWGGGAAGEVLKKLTPSKGEAHPGTTRRSVSGPAALQGRVGVLMGKRKDIKMTFVRLSSRVSRSRGSKRGSFQRAAAEAVQQARSAETAKQSRNSLSGVRRVGTGNSKKAGVFKTRRAVRRIKSANSRRRGVDSVNGSKGVPSERRTKTAWAQGQGDVDLVKHREEAASSGATRIQSSESNLSYETQGDARRIQVRSPDQRERTQGVRERGVEEEKKTNLLPQSREEPVSNDFPADPPLVDQRLLRTADAEDRSPSKDGERGVVPSDADVAKGATSAPRHSIYSHGRIPSVGAPGHCRGSVQSWSGPMRLEEVKPNPLEHSAAFQSPPLGAVYEAQGSVFPRASQDSAGWGLQALSGVPSSTSWGSGADRWQVLMDSEGDRPSCDARLWSLGAEPFPGTFPNQATPVIIEVDEDSLDRSESPVPVAHPIRAGNNGTHSTLGTLGTHSALDALDTHGTHSILGTHGNHGTSGTFGTLGMSTRPRYWDSSANNGSLRLLLPTEDVSGDWTLRTQTPDRFSRSNAFGHREIEVSENSLDALVTPRERRVRFSEEVQKRTIVRTRTKTKSPQGEGAENPKTDVSRTSIRRASMETGLSRDATTEGHSIPRSPRRRTPGRRHVVAPWDSDRYCRSVSHGATEPWCHPAEQGKD